MCKLSNVHVVLISLFLAAWTPIVSGAEDAKATAPFRPPQAMPTGPMGDAIRYGEKVLTQTQVYAKKYVGNGLNCTSCHLGGGKTPFASPWVGLWGVFPEYRSRNAAVNTLQDRVNDCFQRSMNGKALPADSAEMRGVLAYIWWLSRDVPTGVEVNGRGFKHLQLPAGTKPDTARGRELYAEKCAACHGKDGQGMTGPKGQYQFPALWGAKSFNIGAGMARISSAGAFVKTNMPLGQGNTLADRDALDIADYVIHQPRPDYPAKKKDWPKGDKPADARY